MEMWDCVDLVKNIVGPIEPTGSHGVDEERLENLIELEEIVEHLLRDIKDLVDFEEAPEKSVKAIGKHAAEFIDECSEI